MNFSGPFIPDLHLATAAPLGAELFLFAPNDAASANAYADTIVVPDKHLLFTGDYQRTGNDLVLFAQDQKYVIHDYFRGEKRAALVSEDGATVPAHVIAALTGHVQYAQAAAPDATQVVGHVMKLTGSASVIRNGVTVELNVGDAVLKGDVVQTGSDTSIAMTLSDGSAFGMTSNARMVLNEMVYDPNGSSNSSFISLVQGTVTFVAGQTAKNGNMRVETPVATMGIRGTAVLFKANAVTGTVEVSLGVEPDPNNPSGPGHVGSLVFYNNTTGALIGTMSAAGRVTVFSPSGQGQPVTATEYQKSPDQAFADRILFKEVFQLYFPNVNFDDSKPKSTDHPRTDIGIPPTVITKTVTETDAGHATTTITITATNPDTHKTVDVAIVFVNHAPFSGTNNYFTVHEDDAPFTFSLLTGAYDIDPGAVIHAVNINPPVNPGVTVHGDSIVFDPGAAIFQQLYEGELGVFTVAYDIIDEFGAYANTHKFVNFTVIGVNDKPIAGVAAVGTVNEESHLTLDLLLGAYDIDNGDSVHVANISTLPAGITLTTRYLGVDAADPAYDSLAKGESVHYVIDYDIADNYGGLTHQQANVTINGINDAPLSGANYYFSVAEDDASFSFNLLSGASDVDHGAVLHAININPPVNPGVTVNGDSIVFDPGAADFQQLHDGEQGVITVAYDIVDEFGATASTHKFVEFTVTGVNDNPVAGAPVVGVVNEDGNISVDLLLGSYDVDNSDTVHISNLAALPAGLTFSSGRYIGIDAADLAYDHLAQGHSAHFVINYDLADNYGGITHTSADITINGTNDAPVSGSNLLYSVTEDDAPFTVDLLSGTSDVDDGAVLSAININPPVSPGVTLNGHMLTFDPGAYDFQSLVAGEPAVITVAYDIQDEFGATASTHKFVKITITGTDETAPTLSADNASTAEIGDGSPSLPYGTTKVFGVTLTDPDASIHNETVTASANFGSITKSDGNPLDGDYTVANLSAAFVQGVVYTPTSVSPDGNDKVTVTVTDNTGLSDTLNFVFQQNGPGSATLIGTTGKDIIFSTEGSDTLTGLAGSDNFEFKIGSAHDTVTDFETGIDHIVLNDYPAPFTQGNAASFSSWINTSGAILQTGSDVTIDLNPLNAGHDTILLQNVLKANLSMNDFILHPA
ncbi:MAG: FecR domain-containing protein [Afipia sp.]|nr:FecR domain-containing protein [Afipia sp.]